jgi:hypothetical protein
MRRFGLLLGGAKPLAPGVTLLETEKLEKTLGEFARKVGYLGDGQSFRWPDRATPKVLAAFDEAKLSAAFRELPPIEPTDTFLLVYNGHSKPCRSGDGNDLHISFDDVENFRPERSHTLGRVIEKIEDRNFKRLILVLDCCHAQYSLQYGLRFDGEAVTLTAASDGYAETSSDGGVFLKQMIDSLNWKDGDVADQRVNVNESAITVQSLFDHVSANISPRAAFFQRPTISGSDAMRILPIRQIRRSSITALRTDRRIDSIYWKLFVILEQLNPQQLTLPLLISRCQDEKSFKLLKADGTMEPINEETIRTHIRLLADLGLLKVSQSGVELTLQGIEAASRKSYTGELRNALIGALPKSVSIENIREAIRNLLVRGVVSSCDAIMTELSSRNLYIDNRRLFKDIMRLLPHTFVFERPTRDTVFPGFL